MFLDLYISALHIAFEIQGRQHAEFVKYFHRTREGFARQIQNDVLKARYCEEENITLIVFNHDEQIDITTLNQKIEEAKE